MSEEMAPASPEVGATAPSHAPPDEAVRRRIWVGEVPVVFNLADDEKKEGAAAYPLFKLCSRIGYFPLVVEGMREHFGVLSATNTETNPGESSESKDTPDGEMWMEYNGTPLKWHVPIGVQFDLLSPTELPWPVTVHFKNFPDQTLLRCPSPVKETVRVFYLNTLKEVMYMRHGTAKSVMNLSMSDQSQMWDAIVNSNYDSFWDVNSQLIASEGALRSYPIRVYTSGSMNWIQQPMPPSSVETVQDLVAQLFPNLISKQEGVAEEGNVAPPQLQTNFKVVVQGVAPSLNTPISWLCDNCAYTDNCVHLCVLTN